MARLVLKDRKVRLVHREKWDLKVRRVKLARWVP
jgi:hypothetical protein